MPGLPGVLVVVRIVLLELMLLLLLLETVVVMVEVLLLLMVLMRVRMAARWRSLAGRGVSQRPDLGFRRGNRNSRLAVRFNSLFLEVVVFSYVALMMVVMMAVVRHVVIAHVTTRSRVIFQVQVVLILQVFFVVHVLGLDVSYRLWKHKELV